MPKSLLALPVVDWFAEAVSFFPSTFFKAAPFWRPFKFCKTAPVLGGRFVCTAPFWRPLIVDCSLLEAGKFLTN